MKETYPNRSRSLDDDITNWIFTRANEYLRRGCTWDEAIKMTMTKTETIEEANRRIAIDCGRLMQKEGVSMNEAFIILYENWLRLYPGFKERPNGELHGDD